MQMVVTPQKTKSVTPRGTVKHTIGLMGIASQKVWFVTFMAFFTRTQRQHSGSHLLRFSDILNTAHHDAYILRSMALCIDVIDENRHEDSM